MSCVGDPFVHDIFVSYSHGDVDGTGESRLKQWSQAFAKELESELKAFPQFGSKLRIFLDGKHRPSQGVDPLEPLTDQLQSDIEQSALLAVLMSPHYLGSRWCTGEREWWFTRQRELQLPEDGRVAVVRIWQTENAWPPALCDSRGEQLPGFYFYDRSKLPQRPQPYGWPEPGPTTGDPFRSELLDLAGRISLKLDEIRTRLEEQREARKKADKIAAGGEVVVYLHGRAESAATWEKTATLLSDTGFVVVPSDPDPVEKEPSRIQEQRRYRVETMTGCDALLLLADQDARATDADLIVVGKFDRNSARAISKHALPCALIDAVGPPISTPRRRSTAQRLNVQWIDATQPTWPPSVQEWLRTTARDEAGQ